MIKDSLIKDKRNGTGQSKQTEPNKMSRCFFILAAVYPA